jgi:hypothetical protein
MVSRRTRHSWKPAIAALGVAFGLGCGGSPTPPPREAANSDAYDPAAVDPAFARAVDAYGAHVRRLRVLPEVRSAEGLRHALALLADAIENVPYPGGLALEEVAELIRTDEVRLAMGSPDEVGPPAVKHALELAAGALHLIARGPYRRAPEVMKRVQDLEIAVADIDPGAALRVDRDALLAALVQAERALVAVRAAAARRAALGS